jgi:hypothetical protein
VQWSKVGEFGLVGALLGAVLVWLWRHREGLAEAAQREAAACEAFTPRVEMPPRIPGRGRPRPSRVSDQSEEARHASEARE